MTTNANLAAKLLRNAADFFRNLGNRPPPTKEDMEAKALTFEVVADLVESDPNGENPLADVEDGR